MYHSYHNQQNNQKPPPPSLFFLSSLFSPLSLFPPLPFISPPSSFFPPFQASSLRLDPNIPFFEFPLFLFLDHDQMGLLIYLLTHLFILYQAQKIRLSNVYLAD